MSDNSSASQDTRLSIAELPDHERPRERLENNGSRTMKDSELLAILIRTGRHGLSALDLAQNVLHHFHGNLVQVSEASLSELCTIRGIGKAKAVEISAAFELARRLSAQNGGVSPKLDSPARVADLMRENFRGKKQEEFHALLLDTKNRLIRDRTITVGLVDRSQIHAREVFREAIREASSRIILVHNHPSGDPTPSSQDISCTKSLIEAGEIVGISVLDHVVIGATTEEMNKDYLSFKDEKLC